MLSNRPYGRQGRTTGHEKGPWRSSQEAQEGADKVGIRDFKVVELGKAERSWGEGRPAVSIPEMSQNLDHQPGGIHQLIWGPQHTYSRGLLHLCSVKDDASNPQETEAPGSLEVRWGGEEVWDVEHSKGGWGGIKYGV
jgi:hypothetical protein